MQPRYRQESRRAALAKGARLNRFAGLAAIYILLGLLPRAVAQAQPPDPLREDIMRLLVRINAKLPDSDSFGAGIVIGAENDQIYIVTANHVVREGSQPGHDVQVEFRGLRGKPFPANLASHFDVGDDLAVIIVPNAKMHGIDVNSFPFDRVGDPASLTRGDPVFLAGHPQGVPWSLSVTPDGFVETDEDWLRFESKSLYPGHSGGALLNFHLEIVGLLRSDQQPNGEALSIVKVLAMLKEWGYPVKLRQRFTIANLETLSTGAGHTCYVNSRGVASCWGSNSDGELGNGTGNDSPQPLPVRGRLVFVSVSAGFGHTCGVTATAAAFCWGDNASGQLGGDPSEGSKSPVPVTGGISFASVSAGLDHSCGLTTRGAAYCWGDNESGQLGTGNKTASAAPAAVTGGHVFSSVRAGSLFTCGITNTGSAHCWGGNSSGQLGNGSKAASPIPVPVSGGLNFISISAGDSHACGVTTSGKGYCWGENEHGQLGDGSDKSSLVPVPVAGGLTFAFISAGKTFSCGLTRAGAPYCWGWGDDAVTATETDAATNIPAPVFGSRGLVLKSVSAGMVHACGLTAAGEVYCWGMNNYGQLGNGSKDESVRPVLVSPQP
jgi:alpha-tubulin suppressor-like RCC1 family protein